MVYSYAEKNGAIPGRVFILFAYRDLYELRKVEKYADDMLTQQMYNVKIEINKSSKVPCNTM